jgi:hypothetical protein
MTLTVRRVARAAGVSANPYFLYGWHTYQWAIWAPAADWAAEVWTDFHVSLGEQDPVSGFSMLLATVEVNIDGLVSVVWGERSEAYHGETGPVPMKAGVPQTIECFTVRPNIQYFVNAKWSGVLTYPTGGSLARTVQFGELVGEQAP